MRKARLLLFSIFFLIFFFTSCPLKNTFTLTMQKEGNGTTDPTIGTHQFGKNVNVTVRAYPDSGWEFDSWEGGVAAPDATETTIFMDRDRTVKAKFVEINQIGKVIEKLDPSVPLSFYHAEELLPLLEDNIDKFLQLLSQGSYLERWAAAYAFQRSLLDNSTLEELEDYLSDPDPTIKALIAVAFLLNGDEKGKAVLEGMLADDNPMNFSVPPQRLSDFSLVILNNYYPLEYPLAGYEEQTSSVTGGPCDYTVTVTAVFHGAGATDTLVETWETQAEEIWNGPTGSREWGNGCCTVTFDFDFDVLEEGEDPPEGVHVIEVKDLSSAHTSWVAPPLPTPGSTATTTAEWDNLDSGPVVAHEIGHLMGLDDEYHYDEDGNYVNDNPQPEGSPPSIMAQTWNGAQPLTQHMDAIMAAADIQCECDYSMTITPEYDINISPGVHTVEVTVVRADGTPAKGTTVTFTVIGNPNIEDTEVKTGEDGKASFTYFREFCYTNEDEVEAWAKCNAHAMALKQWISLSWILPGFISPYNGQMDFPYSTPLIILFEIEPKSAEEAENLEFFVKLFRGEIELFAWKGKETAVETGLLLEPGTEYRIEITPVSGPPETEGNMVICTFTTADFTTD